MGKQCSLRKCDRLKRRYSHGEDNGLFQSSRGLRAISGDRTSTCTNPSLRTGMTARPDCLVTTRHLMVERFRYPVEMLKPSECDGNVDHEASKLQHPRVTPHFSCQFVSTRSSPFYFASAHIPLVAMYTVIGHHSPKPTLLSYFGSAVIHLHGCVDWQRHFAIRT